MIPSPAMRRHAGEGKGEGNRWNIWNGWNRWNEFY